MLGREPRLVDHHRVARGLREDRTLPRARGDLRRRRRRTHGRSSSSSSSSPPPGLQQPQQQPQAQGSAIELALLRQGELLTEVVGKMNAKGTSQGSSITVQPQVKWPYLDDSVKDIREWKEEFERICGLANDCRG